MTAATGFFDVTEIGKLAGHAVAGFAHPIPAVCYRGDALRSGDAQPFGRPDSSCS